LKKHEVQIIQTLF